jgi:hypothetical protein
MGLNLNYLHTSTLPRLHHVVWCRLPESNGSPGSNVRPALVRGTKRDRSRNRGGVLCSYGTANLNLSECGLVDLIIQNWERLDELELPQAVRFDLDLENWLPWCAEFFCAPAHSPYIIAGPLSSEEIGALRMLLKRRGIITEL